MLVHRVPDVTPADAERLLADHWGIRAARLEPLPGERDRNLSVWTPEGSRFVLKVAGPEEDGSADLQTAALERVLATPGAPVVPAPVPTARGTRVIRETLAGVPHALRVLAWVPGQPLAQVAPHSPALLRDLGDSLGRLTAALAGFDHPAAHRALKWDLAAAGWILDHVDRVGDPVLRRRLEQIGRAFADTVAPALATTRRQVVYNDANDWNILVEPDADGEHRISGLLDFGDLLWSHPVCDVAIALTYAMMGKPDPVTAGAHVVAGYHRAFPLAEPELALLFPLVQTRLAVSLTNAALQAAASPDNAYLQVSVEGARALLERLDAMHPRLAEYRFRDACGHEPCPAGPAVRDWLSRTAGRFAPLLGRPLAPDEVYVHDFSVSSQAIGTIDQWQDQRRFSRLVEADIASSGARVGIGRYDEARAIYTTDLFRFEGNDGPEWRTVHLGIDVGAAPGTAIHAPLGGTVHSLADNAAPGDYGPTIVLEHDAEGSRPRFWTLYGHLSRESLARHRPGDRVEAGALLGWLGELSVNGGWWPHVHVQVITDLLGRSGDFPGVARPAERTVMLSLCPDPTPLLGLPAAARAPLTPGVPALLERRRAHIGPSLSVSYRRPLHIVRGVRQYLVDADGRRYLDAVNNVAHVGHAHPDVVRAGERQMATLNTNTRYLHDAILEYAEQLVATLPAPLRVCYFVCSGSEANELALRLARTATGQRDVIVLEAGYHGNTTTLVDVSAYKFDGPGGEGAPPWVHVVPMPDTYRGAFRDAGAGLRYAQAVREAVGRIRQAGRRPAAFLCESILSCAGQVPLPPGYLAEAYRHVRAAGGLGIADEVQVGLGRVGTHWWAFEAQGVVPDIVTMGKPLGNGHPLGAVVTTPEIAARFANGMEYFNTFGGNPVSCAIGREVLAVMEREGLRERARETGAYLTDRLRDLGGRHPAVGDVRGTGLFLGVELVEDRDTRAPAGRVAAYVANRMRDAGVLVSTDGPHHNVLKIKPPLCFDRRDADQLAATMDRVLGETAAQ